MVQVRSYRRQDGTKVRAHSRSGPAGGAAATAVAVAVAMPTEAAARCYLLLVDRHGTGNVTELSRERGRYRTIRFTGIPYASRQDARVVTNVQAEPVLGRPAAAVLRLLADTAAAG